MTEQQAFGMEMGSTWKGWLLCLGCQTRWAEGSGGRALRRMGDCCFPAHPSPGCPPGLCNQGSPSPSLGCWQPFQQRPALPASPYFISWRERSEGARAGEMEPSGPCHYQSNPFSPTSPPPNTESVHRLWPQPRHPYWGFCIMARQVRGRRNNHEGEGSDDDAGDGNDTDGDDGDAVLSPWSPRLVPGTV